MNQPQQLGTFEHIALAAIRPSLTNPRKTFDPLALEELARSVAEMGVTQPLLLRPLNLWHIKGEQEADGAWLLTDGNRRIIHFDGEREAADERVRELNDRDNVLEVVSGERRYRAAKAAGLDGVPAIVRYLTDQEALDIQMIENLQREDLHPVEEAEGYRALLAQGATAEDVAKKAGKTLAYVKQRIALLVLGTESRRLFQERHVSLEHALLLARLTLDQQEKACLYLLGLREWDWKGRVTAVEAIAEKLKPHVAPSWMSQDERDRRDRLAPTERKVNPTAAELKEWITSNVLLLLETAPWDLADATLFPAAGPCTTCPKRTGANVALFSDLTMKEDICTDPSCFEQKTKLHTIRSQAQAKELGSPLLKISAKASNDKLATPVVELKPSAVAITGKKAVETKRAVVTSTRAVKSGQWVDSVEGACPTTVRAIAVDGPDQGKTKWVCPDQACKVHKHTVVTPTAAPAGQTAEQRKAGEDKRKFEEAIEEATDGALLVEIDRVSALPQTILEFFFGWYADNSWQGDIDKLCKYMEIKPGKNAMAAFKDHLKGLRLVDFPEIALGMLVGEARESWNDSITLTTIAEQVGIDVDVIAGKVRDKAAADLLAAQAKTAAPAKKAAKKTVPAKQASGVVDGKSAGAGAAAEARSR